MTFLPVMLPAGGTVTMSRAIGSLTWANNPFHNLPSFLNESKKLLFRFTGMFSGIPHGSKPNAVYRLLSIHRNKTQVQIKALSIRG